MIVSSTSICTNEDVKLSKDDGLQIVEVRVSNSEGYAKQVRVSLIIDSNKKLPFNGFQESEIIILESDKDTVLHSVSTKISFLKERYMF